MSETLDSFLVNQFQELISKSEPEKTDTSFGLVSRKDRDGVIWVRLVGSDQDTPAVRSTISVDIGDLIRGTVKNGRLTITDNVSSVGVNVNLLAATIGAVASGDTSGIRDYINDLTTLKILSASINQLESQIVRTEYLEANYATIKLLEAEYMKAKAIEAEFLNVDFANFNAANVDMMRVRDLFAKTGLFENLTVLGDGSITGLLTATLLDGDTARFSNIYADALKLLGEDGLYHALNLVGMNSTDAQVLVDKYGQALDSGLHGSRIIAESVTADKIDVTSLMAAMIMAQFIQIGDPAGIHIESVANRLSFLIGGASLNVKTEVTPVGTESPVELGWFERDYSTGLYHKSFDESVVDGKTYYTIVSNTLDPYSAANGEVAYIAVDPNTNESVFYMSHTVVLKTLKFGKWMWFERPNSNMALKWMG